MATHLNLSVNELSALLTRTFEALYGHKRDYYDMARIVLWLECQGHNGVSQFINALPVLDDDDLPEPDLSERAANHLVIDGRGHSLFCIARAICDLSISCAANAGPSQIDIINVRDSQPLIGALYSIASQGFSAVLFYDDKLAAISAKAEHPIIYQNKTPHDLRLICAQNDDILDKYIDADLNIQLGPDVQRQAHAFGLEQGMSIKRSHYDTLTKIANRVLVEASEASRRGAGEG